MADTGVSLKPSFLEQGPGESENALPGPCFRSKIRIKKWLDIPDLPRYEDYVCSWHYLLMDLQTHIERAGDESYQKQVSMYVLQNFYLTPYPEEGFYEAFQERYETCKKLFHLA